MTSFFYLHECYFCLPESIESSLKSAIPFPSSRETSKFSVFRFEYSDLADAAAVLLPATSAADLLLDEEEQPRCSCEAG